MQVFGKLFSKFFSAPHKKTDSIRLRTPQDHSIGIVRSTSRRSPDSSSLADNPSHEIPSSRHSNGIPGGSSIFRVELSDSSMPSGYVRQIPLESQDRDRHVHSFPPMDAPAEKANTRHQHRGIGRSENCLYNLFKFQSFNIDSVYPLHQSPFVHKPHHAHWGEHAN